MKLINVQLKGVYTDKAFRMHLGELIIGVDSGDKEKKKIVPYINSN